MYRKCVGGRELKRGSENFESPSKEGKGRTPNTDQSDNLQLNPVLKTRIPCVRPQNHKTGMDLEVLKWPSDHHEAAPWLSARCNRFSQRQKALCMYMRRFLPCRNDQVHGRKTNWLQQWRGLMRRWWWPQIHELTVLPAGHHGVA
jgi:hypothetical protein